MDERFFVCGYRRARARARLLPGLLALLVSAAPVHASVFVVDDTSGGGIPFVSTSVDANPLTECVTGGGGTQPLERTFTVGDSFTVGAVGVGLNISHNSRDDVVAVLESPAGTRVVLLNDTSGDPDNNYDVLLVGNSETTDPDDGDADDVGAPLYHRDLDVNGLNVYAGEGSAGTWRLYVCDDTPATDGTLNSARLILESSTDVLEGAVCSGTASYEWADNGADQLFVSAAFSGITLSQVSTSDVFGNALAGADFRTVTTEQGAHTGHYRMGFNAPSDETGAMIAVFSFDPPVRDLAFSLLDVDLGSWEDLVRVTPVDAGGAFLPYDAAEVNSADTTQITEVFEGDGTTPPTSDDSNVDYFIPGPVSQVTVEYFTGDTPEDPNNQFVGITDFSLCAFDFGDAPDSYSTTLGGGARHVLGRRDLHLGASAPDGETDGVPGALSAGDGADEDGVPSFPAAALAPGASYTVFATVTNATGASATLCGWLDFDLDGPPGDGTFESDEGACVTVPAAGGGNASCTEGTPGVFSCAVSFTVPGDFVFVPDEDTYARFRVTSDAIGVGDPSGQASDGEVEDYLVAANTLPVTVAAFSSRRTARGLSVEWTTGSEHVNAGFRLWGRSGGGRWEPLREVPSRVVDSGLPTDYALALGGGWWDELAIEDVDLKGRSRWHGPFAVGGAYGERPSVEPIDWAAVRAATGVRTAGDLRSGAGRPAKRFAPAREARLLVDRPGVQRVTHQRLLAAGVDLSRIPASSIAVLDGGAPVSRHVGGGPVWGSGSFVEFVAEPQLTLASPFDYFTLVVDPARALPVREIGRSVAGVAVGEYGAALDAYPDNGYSFASPTDDPWYDARLQASSSPVAVSRTFDLPGLTVGPAALTVDLWGGTDWPGPEPDHLVTYSLNGVELEAGAFDGIRSWRRTFDVTGLVTESGNVLEVTLAGRPGVPFDIVYLEGFRVDHRAETRAVDGRWRGVADGEQPFTVDGLGPGPAVAWFGSPHGLLRIEVPARPAPVGYGVSLPWGDTPAWIAGAAGILEPGVLAEVPAPASASAAEHLIVAHPAFAAHLDDLVALEIQRGLDAEVVTVDRVYARYSDHAPDPEAIRRFLRDSHARGNLRYVLLVGGDTFDPHDHLGLGAVSLVPTLYARVNSIITYAPSDELLADFDGDRLAEVAIGRLPVRTPDELAAVVAKQWAWQGQVAAGAADALIATGISDQDRDFAAVGEGFAATLPAWQVGTAFADDLGVAAARAEVLAAFDSGRSLISYLGHTSFGLWNFTPLLHWQDVASMANHGDPALVTQWGCWNSYFVSPQVETLSDHLLLTPEVGAVAAVGSTTLTSGRSHRLFGERFFAAVGAGAPTLGDALLTARRDLANAELADEAVVGMALLGDPATPLPPVPARR